MKPRIDQHTKEMLESAYREFAQPDFIPDDPIQIPHRFSKKEDIEVAGFLTATIAWGQRPTIIRNANRMLELMDNAPHDFVVHHTPQDRKRFEGFVHRTFNATDAMYFMESLQRIYLELGSIERAFGLGQNATMHGRIGAFHDYFFGIEHLARTRKHVSDPRKGSSAKRLNMYVRWMVRPNKEGVDFGIWNQIDPSELIVPLDVHTGTVGRKLGLLQRKQDDWKAAEELTAALRALDPQDPVRYDLALFGLGVSRRLR